MIVTIILRFGLLFVVFYDGFPSRIEKKLISIFTFASVTPFIRPRDPLGSRPPGWETLRCLFSISMVFIHVNTYECL